MHVPNHVGRRETQRDVADPNRIAGLAALLDHDAPPWKPGMLPPLGHFLCFPPLVRQGRLGEDGHPERTDEGLLPAVALPRRMWAGSTIQFLRDIPLGSELVRVSTLIATKSKEGRSGNMLFVTLRHEIAAGDLGVAIIDDQDIVYREAAAPGGSPVKPADMPEPSDVSRTVTPDPVTLFRYSALTFNSHRIHYDRDYSRDVEHYPGLVVQGPLIATLLLDNLLREQPGAEIETFRFRAMSPLFDGQELGLGLTRTNNGANLQAIGPDGIVMTASAEVRA